MTSGVDREYYERRLNEECERARRAVDTAAATVHRDLAMAYEKLLRSASTARAENTLVGA